MKHLKKTLGFLLALTLLLSLAVPAMAAEVVLSTQTLAVNGVEVPCEKYNIDGSNYFKLRDLACALNDTASSFAVGWDAVNQIVSITTGLAYTPVGGELETGADNSATAQVSAQTIVIDGETVDSLSVYNIGGNNYFKLRDLEDALGFAVGYDEDTRTMAVTAAPLSEAEAYFRTAAAAYDAEDYETAVEWYRKAAELDYAPAQRELSYCYYVGYGVEQDYAEAAELCRKAAEQEDAVAQRLLGFFYAEGIGVEQDYAAGLEWSMKAAEQGDVLAMANVAGFYEAGYGVKQDPERAEYWFGLAAGQGLTKELWYYLTGNDAYYLEKYDEAAEYYRKAAELGHVLAQLQLAGLYEYGIGVEVNFISAFDWYKKAAEQGDVYAQWRVGQAYRDAWGVDRDYEAAVEWFRKAAEQGHAPAQTDLGYCYAEGHGVEQDYAAAVELWFKAAEQEEPFAKYNLGEAYEFGYGVEQDPEQAEYWYGEAAAQGITKEYLEELEAQQPVG